MRCTTETAGPDPPVRGGQDATPIVGPDLAIPAPEAIARLRDLPPRPDYRTMPVPEAQPTSPDPLPAGLRPFRDGPSPVLLGGLVVAVIGALAVLWLVARGRRPGGSA